MNVDIDVTQVRRLSVDLGVNAAAVVGEVRAVVQSAADEIKQRLQAEAHSTGRYKHFSRSITYDTRFTPFGVDAEIGPDKDRTQGALGNLLYFGTARSGPTLPNPGLVLDRAVPRLEAALGVFAVKAIL